MKLVSSDIKMNWLCWNDFFYLSNALMLYGNSPTKIQKSNLSSFLVVLWIKLIVGLNKMKFSNKKLNWALNRIWFEKFDLFKLRILLKLPITVQCIQFTCSLNQNMVQFENVEHVLAVLNWNVIGLFYAFLVTCVRPNCFQRFNYSTIWIKSSSQNGYHTNKVNKLNELE